MRRIAFVVALNLLCSIKGLACICLFDMDKHLPLMVEKSEFVFLGTVEDGISVGDFVAEEVTFNVKKVWKGKDVHKIVLKSLGGCRALYKKGLSYVIFVRTLNGVGEGFLFASSCNSFSDRDAGDAVFLSPRLFQMLIDRPE